MVVFIANHIPNRLRGILKLWFIEPKPNVFISSINKSVAENVIKMIRSEVKLSSGFIIAMDDKTKPDGLNIFTIGSNDKSLEYIFGIYTIGKKINNEMDD
jgi:CRISPR-associated protein Cas2